MFVLYGNNNKSTIDVRIPNNGIGRLEIYINGKPTKNISKANITNNSYLTIVYKQISNTKGHITAYVNNTVVIDEDIDKIKLNDNKIIFNPDEDLNIRLQEVALFNKALTNREINYLYNSGIVLRSIIEYTTSDIFIDKKVEKCEQDCTN